LQVKVEMYILDINNLNICISIYYIETGIVDIKQAICN